MSPSTYALVFSHYTVLFCKRALLKRLYSAQETYNFTCYLLCAYTFGIKAIEYRYLENRDEAAEAASWWLSRHLTVQDTFRHWRAVGTIFAALASSLFLVLSHVRSLSRALSLS